VREFLTWTLVGGEWSASRSNPVDPEYLNFSSLYKQEC